MAAECFRVCHRPIAYAKLESDNRSLFTHFIIHFIARPTAHVHVDVVIYMYVAF